MDYSNSESPQETNQYIAQDDSKVVVEVSDPKVVDGMQKFILYKVKGEDRHGDFDVPRRFHDFSAIRNLLVQKWPGCYIPPLPSKKAIGNMDQKFIDDRRFYLDLFTQRISQVVYMWYSDEFQLFLRTTNPDVEKALSTLQKVTNEEIISKYEKTFSDLSGKEINNQITAKIFEFNAFLKRILVQTDNFKIIAKNIHEAMQNNQDQMFLVLNQLLPEYEKNLIDEYGGHNQAKLIISNASNDQQFAGLLQAYVIYINQYSNKKEILERNEFVELHLHIRQEQRELEAFQETFQQREKYEQQRIASEQKQKDLQIELQTVLAGKTTLKTIFTKTNKEESITNLQAKIEASSKDIQNTTFICDIITVILGHIEIDRFKTEKQQQYYSLVKKIIQFEIEMAKVSKDFWEKVQSNYYLI